MGILNVTTDSFYESSRVNHQDDILAKASEMLDAGADILDFGAYSTRPGADDIDLASERKKLTAAIRFCRQNYPDAIISADTFRAEVAEAAVDSGADLINDVGCGVLDPNMFQTVARLNVPYVLMHNRAMPKDMTKATSYNDVLNDIVKELSNRIERLRELGVKDIILDPGFGFSKTSDQNFELLNRLDEFKLFNLPLLVGISRKKMIYKTLNVEPSQALNGTTALNVLALERGANILRVHDVAECKEAITLWHRMKNGGNNNGN